MLKIIRKILAWTLLALLVIGIIMGVINIHSIISWVKEVFPEIGRQIANFIKGFVGENINSIAANGESIIDNITDTISSM